MSGYEPPPFPPEPANPYAAPLAEIGGPIVELDGDLAAAEAIRKAHLNLEASIKSIGSLHYLGAAFLALGIVGLGTVALSASAPNQRIIYVALIVFYSGMFAVNVALGYGLRRLQSWARWTETVFMGLGVASSLVMIVVGLLVSLGPIIFGQAVGCMIQAYILYLLLCSKAAMVFSPEYRLIIEKTPYLKYRTSLIVKIAIALVVALFVLGILSAFMFGPRNR